MPIKNFDELIAKVKGGPKKTVALVQANDDVEAFVIDSLTREISYKIEAYMLGKVTIFYSAPKHPASISLLPAGIPFTTNHIHFCAYRLYSAVR